MFDLINNATSGVRGINIRKTWRGHIKGIGYVKYKHPRQCYSKLVTSLAADDDHVAS